MRIMHVITGLKQGGAEAMLEKLILTARRCDPGWQHEVIALGALGTVGERLTRAGLTVHALDIRGPRSLCLGLLRLWRILRASGDHSLVQTWLYHADVVGGLLGRLAGRRVFWNLRQTLPPFAEIKRTTRWVIRVGARLSSWLPEAIVCCANSVIESHVRAGYARTRCVLIDNGFDLALMRHDSDGRVALRAQWNISADEMLIGMVGRLDPLKDHDTFIQALAIASRRLPFLRAVLVGRGLEADAALRRRIELSDLRDRVIFAGERADIAAVMSALDVFVLSSRSEGFPNVLGEAMACEVPCVTTDAGDARRLLGSDDWVAPVADPAALADCIQRICALSASARAQIGERLRARIAADFTIEQAWERYRAMYQTPPGGTSSSPVAGREFA